MHMLKLKIWLLWMVWSAKEQESSLSSILWDASLANISQLRQGMLYLYNGILEYI